MVEEKAVRKLSYRGYPLQRQGTENGIIYYGDVTSPYIVQMRIAKTEKLKDLSVSKVVEIKLLMTNTSIKSRDRVVNKATREGLYEAIDLAATWLDRHLKK
ncbi:MAG: hypothetical protein LBD85_05030 [Oscillospiraceae bacterium]|jgi:ribosome-associated translation inhibitor RaiA|nr:hypothetical protein [Oscillospiraceae bacterium]